MHAILLFSWSRPFRALNKVDGKGREKGRGMLCTAGAEGCVRMQEPEKYLPERFMEGTPESAAKPAHGYLPFGDGVRACIGLRFARMEVR